jgi:hypothetical protein
MNILTVIHDNSVTRLGIVDDSAAQATVEVLRTLGHEVEAGFGDVPDRGRYELERLNGILDDIYNYLLEKNLGITIPKPPVQ